MQCFIPVDLYVNTSFKSLLPQCIYMTLTTIQFNFVLDILFVLSFKTYIILKQSI